MISAEQVNDIYLSILGRPPEAKAREWAQGAFDSALDAGAYLLNSDEFLQRSLAHGFGKRPDAECAARDLAMEQMLPWLHKRFDHNLIAYSFAASPAHRCFLLSIDGSDVRVTSRDEAEDHPHYKILLERAERYARHIADAIEEHSIPIKASILLDTDDLAAPLPHVPVFGYQRNGLSNVVSLPDIEILNYDYYQSSHPADTTSYMEKRPSAGFIGSTSGPPYLLTQERVEQGKSPRINAALFFADNSDIDFRITQVVQVDCPETEQAIYDLGVVKAPVPFHTLYGNRFIISMDGNGATCSRVVLALRSQSALIKYDSDFRLYYFSRLSPWRHYIPVSCDSDVASLVRYEKEHPGAFKHVAEAGAEFYYDNLRRENVLRFTAAVLRLYGRQFD